MSFSIIEPTIFAGLIVGAMLPYIISAVILWASTNVGPIICFDVAAQME